MGKVIHVDFRAKSTETEGEEEQYDYWQELHGSDFQDETISPNPPIDFQARLDEVNNRCIRGRDDRKCYCEMCRDRRQTNRIYWALSISICALSFCVIKFGLK